MIASDGNDYFDGGAGNDEIAAGSGMDVFVGGAGNDVIDGGDGLDKAEYVGSYYVFTIENNYSFSVNDRLSLEGTDTLPMWKDLNLLTERLHLIQMEMLVRLTDYIKRHLNELPIQ